MRAPTHPIATLARRSAVVVVVVGVSVACLGASCAFPEFRFGSDALSDAGLDSETAGCTHDCLGGACTEGKCQPVTLSGYTDGGPGGIYVTDFGAIYFTQYYGGRVIREQPDGSVEVVAAGLANPVRVAGSSRRTFATAFGELDPSAAQIVSVGTTGTARRIIAGPTVAGRTIAPWGIVDTGLFIVWTNNLADGSVMIAAQDGQSPRVLATGGRPQELAANAEYVWWIDAEFSRLYRTSLNANGGPSTVVTPDFVNYLAYAAGKLFTASTNTSSIGVIDDPTASGAAVRPLVSRYVHLPGSDELAAHAPQSIGVDDQYVYWLNGGDATAPGSLVRARIDGTGGPALLVANIQRPDQIAVTSAAIYWTTFSGVVQRLAKP